MYKYKPSDRYTQIPLMNLFCFYDLNRCRTYFVKLDELKVSGVVSRRPSTAKTATFRPEWSCDLFCAGAKKKI